MRSAAYGSAVAALAGIVAGSGFDAGMWWAVCRCT